MLKKLLTHIFTGIDNKTFSSKKVGGWVSLIITIIYGFLNKEEHIMFTMAGLVIAFFGLTSFDYIKAKPNKEEEN